MRKRLKHILEDSYPIASMAVKLPERKRIFIDNIRCRLNEVYPQFSETINKRNNIRIKADYEQGILIPELSMKLKMMFFTHNPEALL